MSDDRAAGHHRAEDHSATTDQIRKHCVSNNWVFASVRSNSTLLRRAGRGRLVGSNRVRATKAEERGGGTFPQALRVFEQRCLRVLHSGPIPRVRCVVNGLAVRGPRALGAFG